jgi:hypothetical protein
MPVDEFNEQKAAIKRDIIANLEIGDLFASVMDTDLRNGVGHNATHYDAETDEVVLYETKGNDVAVLRRIPYTQFCDEVLRLVAVLERAAIYYRWLHIHAEGNLK